MATMKINPSKMNSYESWVLGQFLKQKEKKIGKNQPFLINKGELIQTNIPDPANPKKKIEITFELTHHIIKRTNKKDESRFEIVSDKYLGFGASSSGVFAIDGNLEFLLDGRLRYKPKNRAVKVQDSKIKYMENERMAFVKSSVTDRMQENEIVTKIDYIHAKPLIEINDKTYTVMRRFKKIESDDAIREEIVFNNDEIEEKKNELSEDMFLLDESENEEINNEEINKISFDHFYDFSIALFSSLKLIHEKNIFHNDIKVGNILLDEHNLPVIVDFGFCLKNMNPNSAELKGEAYSLAHELSDIYETYFEKNNDFNQEIKGLFDFIQQKYMIGMENENITSEAFISEIINEIELLKLKKNIKQHPHLENELNLAHKIAKEACQDIKTFEKNTNKGSSLPNHIITKSLEKIDWSPEVIEHFCDILSIRSLKGITTKNGINEFLKSIEKQEQDAILKLNDLKEKIQGDPQYKQLETDINKLLEKNSRNITPLDKKIAFIKKLENLTIELHQNYLLLKNNHLIVNLYEKELTQISNLKSIPDHIKGMISALLIYEKNNDNDNFNRTCDIFIACFNDLLMSELKNNSPSLILSELKNYIKDPKIRECFINAETLSALENRNLANLTVFKKEPQSNVTDFTEEPLKSPKLDTH